MFSILLPMARSDDYIAAMMLEMSSQDLDIFVAYLRDSFVEIFDIIDKISYIYIVLEYVICTLNSNARD